MPAEYRAECRTRDVDSAAPICIPAWGIFATDPARALAEVAQSRSLSAPYGLERQNFWFATEMAQRAARHPQGCVEVHVRTTVDRSTWSAVGKEFNPCPWAVPSVWREAPTPIGGWSRG